MIVEFQFKEGGDTIIYRAKAPNDCPICRSKINPHLKTYNANIGKDKLQAVFQCNDNECNRYFIGYYLRDLDRNLVLKNVEPKYYQNIEFTDFIKKTSSKFISIYNEAGEAKERHLDQISGPGFRKAFEFLIKDYAKSKSKKEEYDKIERTWSNDIVKNYIEDERIQKVAERALWVGNDETHYLKIWKDKDLNDLLNLIDLTIHWIEIEHGTEKYQNEMPNKKGKM